MKKISMLSKEALALAAKSALNWDSNIHGSCEIYWYKKSLGEILENG